jgi:hypothetical protein
MVLSLKIQRTRNVYHSEDLVPECVSVGCLYLSSDMKTSSGFYPLCSLLWLNMISAYFPKMLGWNAKCPIIRTVTLIPTITVRLPIRY